MDLLYKKVSKLTNRKRNQQNLLIRDGNVQWRRSVVKSEGSWSLRSSHQNKSRPKFVFVFGTENGPLAGFYLGFHMGGVSKYQGVLPLSLPFPLSSSLPPVLNPSPSPPSLQKQALKSSQGVWGSAVSSSSGVWGGAPAEIEFDAF